MLDFEGRERLRECVGDHIRGRAVDELNGAILADPTEEMETNVDVFRACVVLVVSRKSDRGLVVGKQSRGGA